jgi:hypothetical protein
VSTIGTAEVGFDLLSFSITMTLYSSSTDYPIADGKSLCYNYNLIPKTSSFSPLTIHYPLTTKQVKIHVVVVTGRVVNIIFSADADAELLAVCS